MARSDRLFRLLQALRTLPQPVTAERLAAETEVSVRTLYRDIDSLRAAGALIEGEPGFGYRLTEDPALPPQTFTRLEIEALVLGLGEVGQKGDRALAASAQSALAKIRASLPERLQRQVLHSVMQVYRLGQPAPETDLSIFWQACWDEEALDIVFSDRLGGNTQRRIYPLSLVYVEKAVVLLAWCCLRQDYRRFEIARITNMQSTGESFRPRRAAMLREYVSLLGARRREYSERMANEGK